ncbi:MAG: flagellar basal body P-ring formation protein FlgA [Thermodesulfobacteria bacterium]|nr:flagellar basal body P-ring formation protein FlgA [Thermodesulfobacteriota bacterium]
MTLTVLLFVGLVSTGWGKTLETTYFQDLFFNEITKHLPWPAEDLILLRFTAEPEKLELPPGAKEVVHVRQTPRVGSNTILVDYYLGRKLIARVRLLGYVEAMLPVLVLKRPLARHQIIQPEDLGFERRPLSRLPKDALTKAREAVGLRTRVGLRAGQVLRRSALEVPPVIKRGKLVRILAEGPGFMVSAVGEARQDGRPGEIIRVRNLTSKREVFARVIDGETVKVTY